MLAHGKVLHVGDGVAMIVAESKEIARDAADAIEVEYEELDAVVNPHKAVQEGAVQVHAEAPGNMAYDWELGNPKEEVAAALAGAAHVTELSFVNQRVVPNAIEPRSAIGDWDDAYGRYTLYTSTQNPHLVRLLLSAFVLGLPEHKVRVVGPDVGGGFGSKIFHYTEEALVVYFSNKIGRPIKWTAERSESFVTDAHGRDHISNAKMGFDEDGNIVGLQIFTHANMGAYLSTFAPAVPTYLYGTLLQGLYKTPKI